MEADDGGNYDTKTIFGYNKIIWEIENFLPSTCKKKWVIQSPEFCVEGPHLTRWRLILKGKNVGEYCLAWTLLERLQCDSFSGSVQVNWKFSYPSGDRKLISKENCVTFEVNSTCGTKIEDMDIIERNWNYRESNKFIVQCSMFVYIAGNIRIIERSRDRELKSLSEDLTVLYNLRRGSDTQLLIGKKEKFHAHRAIICSRNSVLKNLVEKHGKIVHLDFPNLNLETLGKIIGYLYTGNLKYILRKPTFAIEKAIEYFNINKLKYYFSPNELTLQSKFDASEFNFLWQVDVTSMRNSICIASPDFRLDSRKMKFQFFLYPNGIDNDKKHMSIFLRFLEGTEAEDLCLEFAIKDTIKNCHIVKRLRWSSEYGGYLGFKNFVSANILQNPFYMSAGLLQIFCKLQIANGFNKHFVVRSRTYLPVFVEKEKHYDLLSKQIASLFKTGEYSDFTIICGVLRFRVHKMLISFRSHMLEQMIREEKDNTSITLSYIDSNILYKILHYIYSGTVGKNTTADMLDIYVVAGNWNILPLIYACSRTLAERLQTENVLMVLIAAHKYKDCKLKKSAFKFICDNMKEVETKSCWKLLVDKTSNLCSDFIKFKRKYIERASTENNSLCKGRDILRQ